MGSSTYWIADIIFVIAPALVVAGIIFTFAMLVSPRLRGKMMSRDVKAAKHMLDASKTDLEDIYANTAGMRIAAQERVLDANAEAMEKIAAREAEIRSAGVEATARAVRQGLAGNQIYCKACGMSIDGDSRFCKRCGTAQ